MSWRLRHLTRLLMGLLVFAAALPAAAQRDRGRKDVHITGELTGIRPGWMQVEAKDGQTWLVKIEARPENILYTAVAQADWLRPGMWVRFRGNFNQKGKLQSDLTDVTVFTPTKEMQVGVVAENSIGEGLFTDEDEKPGKVRPDPNQVVPYQVTGRVAGIKRNEMTVAAGNVPVAVPLPEDLRIAVEVADYSLAQPGDSVEIRGWSYPMAPGRAVCNRLTINADKPLTAAKPDPRRGNSPSTANEDTSSSDKAAGDDALQGKADKTEKPNRKRPAKGSSAD